MDRRRRRRVALSRQDVENDVGGMDALGERLRAGGLHRRRDCQEFRVMA